MITRYGYDVFFTITTFCLILAVISFVFIEPKAIRSALIIFSIVLFGFTLNFFRDPDRTTPKDKNFIIAPADGEVIAMKRVYEAEFMNDDVQQISIFMSPLNVHVNRNPISGIVEYLRYVQGEYFAANADKASERNEQMVIGMQNAQGKVLFKQIAGFIARRIVCSLKKKDTVTMGERFGMIKFGSRVDVFVPKNAVIRVESRAKDTGGRNCSCGIFQCAERSAKPMRITRAVVPSLFTTLNIFCGFLAIISAQEGHIRHAAWFIILAAIFDSLDGVMARITKSSSQFGVELDSLADVVSFGAAPSFMAYMAYLHSFDNVGIVHCVPAFRIWCNSSGKIQCSTGGIR